MNKEYVREYKQGRQKKFFLRENNGTYFLEKITKACGFTVACGTEEEITKYINDNKFVCIGLIVR